MAPDPRSLEDLPFEILSLIIQHSYTPWSLSILDRVVKGTLAIDGLPLSPLFRVSKTCASLALHAERVAFTGELIFTTSCTQWRVLTRLRTLSPLRLGALLDGIHTLRFCSPPLFTNRIPWTALPGLQRVELDYCKRSATFRAQGTLRELEAGYLDTLIVGFARDSERFDGPVVEDAWRANVKKSQHPHQQHMSSSSTRVSKQIEGEVDGDTQQDQGSTSASVNEKVEPEGITVVVTKTMNVTESPNYCPGITPIPVPIPLPFGGSCARITENWKIRVTALHRGKLDCVTFRVLAGFHEVPADLKGREVVVWTSQTGFRETVPSGRLGAMRLLEPSDLGLKFCF